MHYNLMTIDVWDTLLRRNCHDDSSKLASAYRMALVHHHQLQPGFHDYWDIFHARCHIEAYISRERERTTGMGDGEYTIDEVLTTLCQRILLPGTPPAPIAADAAAYELDFEMRHTYADPTITKVLSQYPASQRYFLSDFYMPAKHLHALLAHHKLDTLVDGGFSSCDSGLNKRRGNLYPFVHNTLGVSAHEHLHIGDNPHADVSMAEAHGITAVHYVPEQEHARRQQRSPLLHDRQALFSHIAHTIDMRTAPTITHLPHDAQAAYRLGLQSAPLYIGFMLHIAEQACIRPLQAVYFFTREGEFFIQVWQQLFPESRLQGIGLPQASTLAVSRIATFAASLQTPTIEDMMRLWRQYSTQSIAALCTTLGISLQDVQPICAQHQIDMEEQIVHPWADPKVQALFADQVFIDVLSARIANSRRQLEAYLAEVGLASQQHVGIVDIGWRGTIQDNLAHVLPHTKVHGFYLGLQPFLNPQLSNCTKSAYGPDENRDSNANALFHSVSILEMLSNSPFGSVTGYTRDDSGMTRPQRLIDAQENAVFNAFTDYFQQGVLAATRIWSTYIDQYIVASTELRPVALRIWETVVATPGHALGSAHAALHHNELFGVGGFVRQAAPPGYADVMIGIVSGQRRRKVIRFIKQIKSPASLWARTDLPYLRRVFLVSLCCLATLFQRIRLRLKHAFF